MTPTDPSRPEQAETTDLTAIDTTDDDTIDNDGVASPALRRGLLAAAVVALALVAAGATGAALARGGSEGALAAATGTPTPGDGDRRLDGDGEPRPGGVLGHHPMGGPGGALHGTFVVPDGDGTFTTMLTQHGTASKVSDTSITVTSEDGFSQTYAITADTGVGARRDGVTGITKGADVVVVAEEKSGEATALHIADLDAIGGPGGFGHRMDGPGPDGGPPAPTPSGSPSGSAEGSASGV